MNALDDLCDTRDVGTGERLQIGGFIQVLLIITSDRNPRSRIRASPT